MNLSAQASAKLIQFFALTARAYGVQPGNPQAGQTFSATPSIAQRLYEKIVEDGNPFLRLIAGLIPVAELKGDKVGMFLTNRVASRTDTTGAGERTPRHLVDTDSMGYELFQTNFDIALLYSLIDSWAKFPDFAARYMKLVREAIGSDMVMIGWHGTSHAATTNISTNPLLQDVNIGWLKQIRDFNSGSQYVLGTVGAPVQLGSTAFANLDVLVHEARQLLPVWHRNRNDLVAIVSNNVIATQEETYYADNGNTPTEKVLVNNGIIMRAYGGMPSIQAPFFPDSSVLVTPLKNLAIYYQDSSVRRTQKDKPEKNQVQEFNSTNMGYVVEDFEMTALIENITFA